MMVDRENGPWMLIPRIQHAIGVRFDADGNPYGTNEIASAMDCPKCASIWMGILVAILPSKISEPLAFSAAVILIGKLVKRFQL